jgi:transposase-like protein
MANHFCRRFEKTMKVLRCPNRDCRASGKTVSGNLIRFGFYQTRWGKRRRYRCQTCNKTFCSNTGTPYYRLQHRRVTFDQVATLSVEGLNKSAIARVERIGWNTVDRWLEKASDYGRRFNDEEITGFRATELQADEIRTIIQGKQRPTWVFAAIEVWSRLWSSTVVGRRSYQNTLALFRDIAERANLGDIPLITTDGFEFYERVIGQVFGPAGVYGQVIKMRRKNHIVKVERRAVIGTEGRFEERRQRSEDSSPETCLGLRARGR